MREAGAAAAEAGDRADVHDPSPSGGDHVGEHGANAVEGAAEVHVEHALPLRVAHVGEQRELADAGDVDEDRGRPEVGAHRRRRGPHRGAVGDVDRPRRRPAAGGRDRRRGRLRARRVQVEHRDRRSIPRQPPADRLPDSRRAPCDHRDALHGEVVAGGGGGVVTVDRDSVVGC